MTLKRTPYRIPKEELKELLFDYNKQIGALPSQLPQKVSIWDETLRDGEQTPGVFLNIKEKIEIAKALDEIGTSIIAAGFPAISYYQYQVVKEIKNIGLNHATILGIARPRESDINECLKCDLNEIVLFMPISDLQLKILKISHSEQIEIIQNAFDYSKEHGIKYHWVSEDGTRAYPNHLMKIANLSIKNQAKSMILGDTVGVLQPETTIYLIEKIKKELNWPFKNTELGIHAHNDFGQAVANTLAAVYHGATIPHVCVNGYGERAGNAAFEEVVVNLEGMGIKTGINLEKLTELSRIVEEKFILPLHVHKPIVGNNAFSHESGLHINAMLSHPAAYEPINPKWVGQKRRIYLGHLSGSGAVLNAIKTKLKLNDIDIPINIIKLIVNDIKQLQIDSSKDEKRKLFIQTKNLVEKIRTGISDKEFLVIVNKHAKKFLDELH